VGAVKCDGILAGLVVSRLAAGAALLTVLDARLSRLADDAVGAVIEPRLALRVMPGFEALLGERGDLPEEDDFLSEIGDLRLRSAAFEGDPVAIASGLWLLRGLIAGLFEGVDLMLLTDFGVAGFVDGSIVDDVFSTVLL
jgi:hypothetical protein